MSRRNKHTGTNAEIVGDTRLTRRQFKKFNAAFHNVQIDNERRIMDNLNNPAFQSDLISTANLGNME